MSSTSRGAARSPNDFYVTDPKEIVRFIAEWRATDPDAETFWSAPRKILDPSAGGLTEQVVVPQKEGRPPLVFMPSEMSYPHAIQMLPNTAVHTVDTLDIRKNSRAPVKGDFIGCSDMTLQDQGYEAVITNPPFSLAIEFIQKSLRIVKPGGYVVMLLRLNFFGSNERNKFFRSGHMPHLGFVHARRLSFTPDRHCDSIEYQHCIWKRTGLANHVTSMRVLEY